jgi:hypothetical protein
MSETGGRTALEAAAARGAPGEVEAALGAVDGAGRVEAAKRGAAAALAAEKWENLAFLADFLADVTSMAERGGSSDGEGPGGEEGEEGEEGEDDMGDRSILGFVEDHPPAGGSGGGASLLDYVAAEPKEGGGRN